MKRLQNLKCEKSFIRKQEEKTGKMRETFFLRQLPIFANKSNSEKTGFAGERYMRIIRGVQDSNSCFVESNYGFMLFDTGAATSQLLCSPATDELEQLDPVQSYGWKGKVTQNKAMVNELIVGEMRAENLAVTLDQSVGVLGMDVLKKYCFSFDMKSNEIQLVDRFVSEIPCYFGERNHIYIKIRIKSSEYWALVDTGASMSLIDEKLCHELMGEKNAYRTDRGEDWTGAAFETQIAMVESLEIGGVLFPPHEFALIDFSGFPKDNGYSVSAIIGASTLQMKRFCFNLADGYIAID